MNVDRSDDKKMGWKDGYVVKKNKGCRGYKEKEMVTDISKEKIIELHDAQLCSTNKNTNTQIA